MTAGKLAAVKPAASTNTRLYQCPINKSSSIVLSVCNQSTATDSTYSYALRDYDQILTLNSSSYAFKLGNVISDYKLVISPGIPTAAFVNGSTINLGNNQGSFKLQDILKPTTTITYPVKVEPVGPIAIDSATQTSIFSIGDTITGSLSGLTATIYRVGTSTLSVKIPQITSSSTSVRTSITTNILANDYVVTSSGEICLISSIAGYLMNITRAQFGTTAQEIVPGSRGDVIRATSTTTTVNEGATFSNIDLTLTVASTTGFIIGDYIKVDNELMQVVSIDLPNIALTVTRGSLGTIAATHANSATVVRYIQAQITYLQFFDLNDVVSNGSGASVDLAVTAGSGALYNQGNRFVYNLGSGIYEFPIFIPVNADRTYRFTQSDASNVTHPFLFSLAQDGTHGGGTEYTTGVTKSGTAGSSGAYIEINLNTSNIGTNSNIFTYCQNHALMTENGFLSVDLTPNYDTIFIFDTTKPVITTSDIFTIDNVNYTITSVDTGPYGYVTKYIGSNLHVSLGINSPNIQATDTFFDSPLQNGSNRTLSTVSSVSLINTEDYIILNKIMASTATEKHTNIVVGPGQSILVSSSTANISFIAYGFEDSSAVDFSPIYYTRQITSL